MKKEAKYEARCADCGGRIAAGEQMDYLPPSGEYAALTTHIECPEPKKVAPRGVNHVQREDPELAVFIERECDQCGSEWMVKRTSLASRRAAFVGHCCDGRYGEGSVTHERARKPRERHLKAVA